MNLQEFLNGNDVSNIEDEVVVSSRLKNPETGELYKFKIRALTDKEWESARRESTSIAKSRKEQVRFNQSGFNDKIVLTATIYPNFKDAESLKTVGCINPESYLHKVLLPGEIAELASKITTLSKQEANASIA